MSIISMNIHRNSQIAFLCIGVINESSRYLMDKFQLQVFILNRPESTYLEL